MTKSAAKHYVEELGRAIVFSEGYIAYMSERLDTLPATGCESERCHIGGILSVACAHLLDNRQLQVNLGDLIVSAHDDGDDV